MTLASVAQAKKDALDCVAPEHRIVRLSLQDAHREIIQIHKLDNKKRQVNSVIDGRLHDATST